MRTVYGLHDGSGEIRYVGMTKSALPYRRRKHVERALKGDQTDRSLWICEVVAAGGEIVVQELERGEWDQQQGWERERFWVARLVAEGADLTNMTSGGAGIQDPVPRLSRAISDAARATHTGRTRPPETGRAISEALKRHYAEHPETREKISRGNTGKVRSAEARKKIGDAHRGKPLTQAHRDAIAAGGRGRTHSAESRQKISDALRGSTQTPETRQAIAARIEANRQRCTECGYESTASCVARHQNKTGHVGRERLSEQP